MEIKIEKSFIVSAFATETIGSKVVDEPRFFEALETAIVEHDPAGDRLKGQMYLPLPEAIETVSAGVGRRTDNPDDYVVRVHRGEASLYLRRELAASVESLAVVVHTAEAYLGDPDVLGSPEEDRIRQSGATHVVVAILASAGPKSPLTPKRFIANLAGGNREALGWTADEIRQKAGEIRDYYAEWGVVAD